MPPQTSSLFILGLLLIATPATAHQVKTSATVGATAHFEPNDRPKAQEPTQAWFALTKRGGLAIPLQDCRCQLRFWQKPGQKNLGTLPLTAIDVEGYRGVPSTTIIFPQAGAYVVEIAGQPVKAGDFQPFRLEFDATVLAGDRVAPQQKAIATPQSQPPATASFASLLPYLLGSIVLLGLGSIAIRRQ